MTRALTNEEAQVWYWTVSPTTEIEHLTALLLRWRVDPISFAVEALRIKLLPYQGQILLDLADAPIELYEFYGLSPENPKRQVLVPSGHGLGKTRAEAIAIWWHKLTYKFGKELVTAPTADQLSGQLWGEIRKMYRRLKRFWPALAQEWEILNSSIVHVNPDFGDWVTIGKTARAEKPEGLQGAHAIDDDDADGQLAELFHEEIDDAPSGGILVIVEEASGVIDLIRETLEGALSEEGALFLACGNVTRPDGWFADDLDNTDRYSVLPLDCRMSNRDETYSLPYRDFAGNVHILTIKGRVRPQYWENIIKECDGDEDADRVRVRVRGLKPRSAMTQTIHTPWVKDAMSREEDKASNAEPAVVGLDFGLTFDKHALAVRRGFNMVDGQEWLPKNKPEEILQDAYDRALEAVETFRNVKYIVGDSNGIGRYVMERLTIYFRKHPEKNVTVIHFNAGKGALDNKRFYRRRDEMWYKKARPYVADPRCRLLPIPGFKSQITAPGYHEDASKRIKVESKEDIKKRTSLSSGNLSDAFFQTLMIEIYEEKPKEVDDKPMIPKLYQEHFKRVAAQELNASGVYIR